MHMVFRVRVLLPFMFIGGFYMAPFSVFYQCFSFDAFFTNHVGGSLYLTTFNSTGKFILVWDVLSIHPGYIFYCSLQCHPILFFFICSVCLSNHHQWVLVDPFSIFHWCSVHTIPSTEGGDHP